MCFARIERDNHALVLDIDFYVLHPGNVLQHRSQFAHALIAIFTFSGDFDRFQNSVVGSFGKNGSAGSGSVGRAGSIVFVSFLYVTSQLRKMVASSVRCHPERSEGSHNCNERFGESPKP